MKLKTTSSNHSINTELSKLLVSVVLIITLFYSLLLLAYSWMVEDNIFNRQVNDEAAYIQEVYQATGNIVDPRAAYMSWHVNWRGLPESVKQQRIDKPDKVEFDHPDGRTMHIKVFMLGKTTYALAADIADFEVSRDFLPGVLWTLVFLSLLCCGLVAIVAVLKAKKITRPLNQLAQQLRKHQNIENIDITGDYPNNEIGALADRTKDAFKRLTQAWEREANFTKDVSHEIRTPVAVSRNILTKSLSQVSVEEWQTLNNANVRLEQTTETLLALARNESTHVTQTNLTELLEMCLLNNADVNYTEKGRNIEFEVECDDDVFRTVNRNLVEILFNNVLSNIVHYIAGNWVSIEISATGITFTNYFQKEPPTNPLQSGEKGENSKGIGHGLSLIRRIAEIYEWRVDVTVTQQKFCLTLNM